MSEFRPAPQRPVAIATATALAVTTLTLTPTATATPVRADEDVCTTIATSSADIGDAAILNLTPVQATAPGFGQLVSSDVADAPPVASSVNFGPGTIDPNVAIAAIGADGRVCFVNSDRGPVELVADHLGTIEAAAYTPASPDGAPVRLVDTRIGQGGTVVAPSGSLCMAVSGDVGDAAIVNLTPVRAAARGFGQLVSSDVVDDPPVASNVNFRPGTVDPNVAIATIGADGRVCFVNSRHGTVDLVADHLGNIDGASYEPASPDGAPVRTVDTRTGQGGDRIAASGDVCFGVAGSPGDAAVVNLTPVQAAGGGNGQLVSSDVVDAPPVASSVNFGPGTVDPNVAIAAIGADGRVCFVNSVHGAVDLVADHLGTIDGSSYRAARRDGAPVRTADTRLDFVAQGPPREACLRPETAAYSTPFARTMFGLASASYAIDPGAPTDRTLDQFDLEHRDHEMGCWRLIAALDGAAPDLSGLTDTQVIVARNDRTHDLAVAFRGSESALDWINDAIATRTDYPLPDGRVIEDSAHLGFAAALAAVEQQLLAVLQANDRSMLDGTRVYFTGHSLGGALATLGSLRFAGALQQLGYTADEIVTYTFGAPRSMTLELVGHHDALLPNTFAVANSDDPVPHLLNSSRSDRYSHVDEMVVWTSDEPADLMRIDRGDGRDYAGCSELTASNSAKLGNFGDHGRDEYDRRLSITNFAGPPSVSLSIPQDSGIYSHEFRMHWDAAVEGPCDRVGMWQVAGTLAQATVDTRTPLSSRNVKVDTNDIHSTGDDKGFDHWIAYTNIFGDIVASREYRPSTPEVWLTVNDNGIFPDTIDLNWSVSDAGSKDLIILYDRDPSQLSDLTDWYVSPVGRVEARATTNSPERKQTFVSTRDVWWVGYVMEDNNGRLWLLDSKRGFGR